MGIVQHDSWGRRFLHAIFQHGVSSLSEEARKEKAWPLRRMRQGSDLRMAHGKQEINKWKFVTDKGT